MRAITVTPGTPGSLRLAEVPEPAADGRRVIATTLAIGVCGTDIEIVSGAYGWAPPGCDRLVLGHESVVRVLAAPAASGLQSGDLAVASFDPPIRCRAYIDIF